MKVFGGSSLPSGTNLTASYADARPRACGWRRIRGLGGHLLHIYVDADACPVKQEVYRVARRYDLGVTLVAGTWMNTPNAPHVALEVVGQGFDAADDWIVAHAVPNDIVITGDIPLAARCLAKGVYALAPAGRPFTESNIGEALATRNLLSEMRGAGQTIAGPPPFDARDRSRFLQALDRAIHGLRRTSTHRDGPGQPREV